jgi:hypothetical protein
MVRKPYRLLATLCALGDDVDYLPMAIPKARNSFGDPLQLVLLILIMCIGGSSLQIGCVN